MDFLKSLISSEKKASVCPPPSKASSSKPPPSIRNLLPPGTATVPEVGMHFKCLKFN
jgi:hypothetical protein